MKILIIAATTAEIMPLIQFTKGKKDIETLITGIGGVATAYTLLKKLQTTRYDLLLQAGIAGGFDANLPLGKVVAVQQDCFGDLGVVENKERISLFDMQLVSKNSPPFKKGWLRNPHKKLLQQLNKEAVTAVSVNEITTAKAAIQYYKNLNAAIESMEGAAFHYVALMEGIPFLQIRSISNFVGERNKAKWELKIAVENLNNAVLEILNQLEN